MRKCTLSAKFLSVTQMMRAQIIVLTTFILLVAQGKQHRSTERYPHEPTTYSELNQAGMPYEFSYLVSDPESYNEYGHQESSDGSLVKGEYRVLLPDGRTQIVSYYVEGDSGFVANVKYEGGEQRNPEHYEKPYKPSHLSSKPFSPYANQESARFPQTPSKLNTNAESNYRAPQSYEELPEPPYRQPAKYSSYPGREPEGHLHNLNNKQTGEHHRPSRPFVTFETPAVHSLSTNDGTNINEPNDGARPALSFSHDGHSVKPNYKHTAGYTHQLENGDEPPLRHTSARDPDPPRPPVPTDESKEPEHYEPRPARPTAGYVHDGYSPTRPIIHAPQHPPEGYTTIHRPLNSHPHHHPESHHSTEREPHDGYTVYHYNPTSNARPRHPTLLARPHEGYPSSDETYPVSHYHRDQMLYVDLPPPDREHYVPHGVRTYQMVYPQEPDGRHSSLVRPYYSPSPVDQVYPNTYVHIEYPANPSPHTSYPHHPSSLVHHTPPVHNFNPYGYTISSDQSKRKRRIH